MNDLNCIKEGLLEYINLSISIHDYYFNKRANSGDDLAKKYKLFCLLKEEIIKSDSLDKVYQLKEEIHLLEKIIELGIKEEKKSNLHSRERALVERGYAVDDVLLVSSYTKEYVRSVAEQYFNKISQGCSTSENPICIFLGGQPGVGKTTTSMKIKSQFPNNNIIEIGIDNYRTLHPKYLEIESLIKKHWVNRNQTLNDSPGNDIADFTHQFAGEMTDIIQELASNKKLNIVMEWAMREPTGPLTVMEDLKNKGYQNIVRFIAVHKGISSKACIRRGDVMNNQNHIIRNIPQYFHDNAVKSLPESCKKIYETGYIDKSLISDFTIIDRFDNVIWDKSINVSPDKIYDLLLNNPMYDFGYNNLEYANKAYDNETRYFLDDDVSLKK